MPREMQGHSACFEKQNAPDSFSIPWNCTSRRYFFCDEPNLESFVADFTAFSGVVTGLDAGVFVDAVGTLPLTGLPVLAT